MGPAVACQKTEVLAIKNEWCKGCGLCVGFCAKGVLSLNQYGKAVIDHPEKCSQCGMCELYCPDFAISMWRPENASKQNTTATR